MESTNKEQILVRITGQDRPGLTASVMGILAKYDSPFMILTVIPAEKTPDLHGMLHVQINIGFTTETVSSKVL